MVEIRNSDNKLICVIDPREKSVEIVLKGVLTTLQFLPNGEYSITNVKIEINKK